MSKPKLISDFKEVEGKGFLFAKTLRVGRIYVFECPKCGTENTVTFGKPGVKKYFCKQCEVKFTASVKEPKKDEEQSPSPQPSEKPDNQPSEKTDVKPSEKADVKPSEKADVKPSEKTDVQPSEKPAESEKDQKAETDRVSHTTTITDDGHFKKNANAALVYGGRFGGLFGKKTVKRLKFGANVVGRNDPGEPSDINIDDDYVSRRSVEITVSKIPGGKDEVYKMILLREPSNPVFVNSQQLTMNSGAIYLNYNDKITLGRTVLTLKKVNK